MKNAKLLLPLVLFFIFLTSNKEAEASHAMGADMFFECMDTTLYPPNTYKVTFQFYRDCGGIPAPPSVNFQIGSSCGNMPNVTATQVSNTGIDVTPLCNSLKKCSDCNNNTSGCNPVYKGVELYVYEAIITFPSKCKDWTVGVSISARNPSTNASGGNLYVETTIDNTISPCNNSPKFTELPTPYICNGQPFNYNHGVIDPDGDSLVFTMVYPKTSATNNVTFYMPNYVNYPVTTASGTFNLDPNTGQMTFTPQGIQTATLAIQVCEYRSGSLIGCTMRDIQVEVINCANNQYPLHVLPSSGGSGTIIDTNKLEICPGDTMKLFVTAVDSNANDSVFITSNIATALPGGTYTVTGVNPTTAEFNWVPALSDTGFNFFSYTIKDNACPVNAAQYYTFQVQVMKSTRGGPGGIYCNSGEPVKLTVEGGTTFDWSPKQFIVDAAPDSTWVLVAPTSTTDFVVTSDLSGLCKNTDTMTVTWVPDFNYNLTPDDTICKFETKELFFDADQQYAPYTYEWWPSDSLSDTTSAKIISSTLYTQKYLVEVESDLGCRIQDSVTVIVQGEKPRITMNASKDYLCPSGDTAEVSILAAPASCGASAQPCSGTSFDYTVGSQAGQTGSPTPYEAYYKAHRMQILYTASDLKAMGFNGGTITEIAFNIANKQSTKPYDGFTIKMRCFDEDKLDGQFKSGFTTVFNGVVSSTTGWNSYQLGTPYNWNGYSNLLVEVCFSNASYSTGDDQVYFTPTTYNSVLYKYSDNDPGCTLKGPIKSNQRPDTRFSVCSPPLNTYVIEWNPTIGLSDSAGQDVTISSPEVSKNTTYMAIVDNLGCSDSAEFSIRVDTSSIAATGDTTVCNTSSVQLNAFVSGEPPLQKLNCGVNGTTPPSAPTSYQVGSGSTPWSGSAFEANNEDMKVQILYRANDLKAAGITSGTISEYSFELASKLSSNAVQNFTISMGCTGTSSLSTSTFEGPVSNVYSTNTYNTVAGWNSFTLQNNFDWDGTSNIVVQICWDNPNGAPLNGTDAFQTIPVLYNAIIRAKGSSASGCSFNSPSGSAYKYLPNTMFGIAPPATGNFEYTWTPSTGLSSDTIANPVANATETTTYYVEVESEFDCPLRDTVTVEVVHFNPTVSEDVEICEGDRTVLTATGGTSYEWSPATGLSSITDSVVTATPNTTTTYTVYIENDTVCTTSLPVTVRVNPLPNVDAGENDTVYIGETITLQGSGAANYSWSPAEGLTNANTPNPTARPITNMTYSVVATDSNGCENIDMVLIWVESIDDLFIPSAFSPNDDGKNDEFRIIPKGMTELVQFCIYNRWGQQIFCTDDSDEGWDGNHKGVKQPIGTYIYHIEGRDYKGEPVIRQGNVTLIR